MLIKRALSTAAIVMLAISGFAQPATAQRPGMDGPPDPRDSLDCERAQDHFGRMFPGLPAATWPGSDLHLLAGKVMAQEETNPTPEGQVDDEENLAIDAGYTYVGQFIDHDLTLDPRPNDLTTPVDPTTLHNFRTPAFDLDSVYGGGPGKSPQLYQADRLHLKLGAPLGGSSTDRHAVDLPRDAAGQALVGDPRDDENRIVAQLHSVFLRFHNLLADRLTRAHPEWSKAGVFTEAQHLVRMHYQWAVLEDFLPMIAGNETVSTVLRRADGVSPRRLSSLFNPCTVGMPVEFSAAAYRFGHSMVRAIYRINTTVQARLPVFTLTNDPTNDLGGFRPSPKNFAIDWSFFFQMDAQRTVGKPQPSYKLDNSLVFPLTLLPLPEAGTGPTSLAERNLLRSVQLGLPSGQAVARAIGARPLRDDQILIGKATGNVADAIAITALSESFAGKAPLWTYVLAEATASAYNVHDGRIDGGQIAPMRLGTVGGRIVVETFAGLLAADAHSILYDSEFRPDPAFTRDGQFGFRELICAVTAN